MLNVSMSGPRLIQGTRQYMAVNLKTGLNLRIVIIPYSFSNNYQ